MAHLILQVILNVSEMLTLILYPFISLFTFFLLSINYLLTNFFYQFCTYFISTASDIKYRSDYHVYDIPVNCKGAFLSGQSDRIVIPFGL